MRFSKLLLSALLAGGLFVSVASADYNKGFKYYNKYIKKKSGVTSTQLLKKLGINDQDTLKSLLKDNAKGLIEAAKKAGLKKVAKGIEKIVKKGKTKDLKDFLIGIMNGKIPAGC